MAVKRPTKRTVEPLRTATTHPWVVEILPLHPDVNPPLKARSLAEAKSILYWRIKTFADQMIVYDKAGTERCTIALMKQIDDLKIGEEGTVEGILDERSGMKFRAVVRPA